MSALMIQQIRVGKHDHRGLGSLYVFLVNFEDAEVDGDGERTR